MSANIFFTKFTVEPSGSRSFNREDWKDYWNSLTESERQSLRDKARWEHVSLSAVAIEWGAVADRQAV